jgi:hypothetical protein
VIGDIVAIVTRLSGRPSGRPHAGTSILETLIAFTLLATVLTFSTSALHRHNRLLSAQRDYRIALDELTNQLDRLSAIPLQRLQAELENMTPSAFTVERLPGAELRGDVQEADVGRRITLRLAWDERKRRDAPVTMAAWAFPEFTAQSSTGTTEGGLP